MKSHLRGSRTAALGLTLGMVTLSLLASCSNDGDGGNGDGDSSGGIGGEDSGDGDSGSGGRSGSGGDSGNAGDPGDGGESAGDGDQGGAPPVCEDVECAEHAECVASDGEAACTCREGFEDDEAGACADVDECLDPAGYPCGLNANCENSAGAFSCYCPESWSGDPDTFCCAPQPPDSIRTSIVLQMGHIDLVALAASCEGQYLSASTKDGTEDPTAYRETDYVLIHGDENAAFTVPEGLQERFEFIGQPGDVVYLLPEGQPEAYDKRIPWVGFDAAAVSPGVYKDNDLTLELVSVDGPGRFVAFGSPQDGYSPPTIIFDPDNDIRSMKVAPGLHSHLNWFFSEPGLYTMQFQAGATRADGSAWMGTTATARFFLGDLADLPETERPVLVIEGLSNPYVSGDTLELSAERYGWEIPLETTWLKQCPTPAGLSDWAIIGTGDALSHELSEDDLGGGCKVRAVIFADGHEEVSSQPVLPTSW